MADTISKVDVTDSDNPSILKDNGGRRIGVDRRGFSYSLHIPERRSHDDRREGDDRRKANRIKSNIMDRLVRFTHPSEVKKNPR